MLKTKTIPSKPISLPVIPSKIRPSKAGKWRAWVLIGVHLLIAAHIAHWYFTGSTLSPLEPSESMEFSKHSVINAGFLFFTAAILLTAIFGRFFCGWGCHIVALQDFCRWLLLKIGIHPKPLRSRVLLLIPLLSFLYMFVYPFVYRIWIGDELAHRGTALTSQNFWATFPGLGIALLTFFVCGFVIVYFLGAKGFCTYACPYGAIFGVADKFSPGRIRVTNDCEGCGHCTATCSSNVRVHEEVRDYGMVIDPGCMKCMDCVSVCPKDALYFGWGKPSLLAKPRQTPSTTLSRAFPWKEEISLAGFAALSFFSIRSFFPIIPFLLALGLCAILSYLCLQTVRLFYKENLTLYPVPPLKIAGQITKSGWLFLSSMSAVFLFWGYSAVVQTQEKQREQQSHLQIKQVESLYQSGVIHAQRGELEAARKSFENALQIRPDLVEARENLAGTLCALGRYREGIAEYEKALTVRPNDANTYAFMARAYLALNEPNLALAQTEKALRLDPKNTLAHEIQTLLLQSR